MISPTIKNSIEEKLSQKLSTTLRIISSSAISGGCINEAFKLETTSGPFFIKLNSAARFPKMFQAEARGLDLLSENSNFTVPKPIVVGESGAQQYLVMDWIESGSATPDFNDKFGRWLADLHHTTQPSFGLNHPNYIGSLPQSNDEHNSWSEFFWNERLLPQIRLASKSGLMTNKMTLGFGRLETHMSSLYPTEAPALLHGDLWSGNYGVSENGSPLIFDPAVYYGHREMDLAMMKLFGGFSQSIFDAYDEHYPLETGWEERIQIGQLYPLMVHVNLFGSSYCRQVEQILSRF